MDNLGFIFEVVSHGLFVIMCAIAIWREKWPEAIFWLLLLYLPNNVIGV